MNSLTRLELAAALHCNPRTVAKWQEDGMPVSSRGRGGRASRYDLAECQAWVEARNQASVSGETLDVVQERARKEHWQAQLAEQLHQTRAKDLLPRAEVEKAWAAEAAAIRARLLAWPTSITDRVFRAATLQGAAGVERVL